MEQYIDLETVHILEVEGLFGNKGLVIKGSCYRSFKKRDKPHSIKVYLSCDSQIINSACSCIAGSVFCNHLVSLLKIISLMQSLKYKEIPASLSCTEMPQQWNYMRKRDLEPQKVMDIDIRQVREGGLSTPKTVQLYDPRVSKDDCLSLRLRVVQLSSSLSPAVSAFSGRTEFLLHNLCLFLLMVFYKGKSDSLKQFYFTLRNNNLCLKIISSNVSCTWTWDPEMALM